MLTKFEKLCFFLRRREFIVLVIGPGPSYVEIIFRSGSRYRLNADRLIDKEIGVYKKSIEKVSGDSVDLNYVMECIKTYLGEQGVKVKIL